MAGLAKGAPANAEDTAPSSGACEELSDKIIFLDSIHDFEAMTLSEIVPVNLFRIFIVADKKSSLMPSVSIWKKSNKRKTKLCDRVGLR